MDKGLTVENQIKLLGLDDVEANFGCLLELPSCGGLENALAKIGRRRGAGKAESLALRGKILTLLYRYPQARETLESVVDLDPRLARARAWLGELNLLEGRFEEARAELGRALALENLPWARFHLAAAFAGLGKKSETRQELERARKLAGAGHPAAAAAEALGGLLEAQERRWDSAAKALGRCVAALPKSGWPYALRARIRKAQGDMGECLKDYRSALERRPEIWLYLERSRIHEEMGDIDRALEDVDGALRLDPRRADLYRRRSHLQVCRRHYHLAAPDCSKALELEPRNAAIALERAMVNSIRNRPDLALEDAALAERLSAGEAGILIEVIRLRISSGKLEGQLRAIERLRAKSADYAGAADFLLGCYRLKSRDFRKAAKAFALVKGGAAEGDLSRKAGFYGVVASALLDQPGGGSCAPGPIPLGRSRLNIIGLGVHPPYSASLETLRAIASCDLIFNNLSEPEIAGLLGLLAPECEPTMYDVRGADSRWTAAIFDKLKPGMTVGFVTRGHPLVCGGLAHSLMEEAERKGGVEYRIYGSISSMNSLAARALPPESGGHWGEQVMFYSSFLSPGFRAEARVPSVLYFLSSVQTIDRAGYDAFYSGLERLYSKEHPCYFYGRTFNMAPELLALRELKELHGKLDCSYTLLLPAKEGAGSR